MQYFDSLPKIIEKDSAGIARIFTNLMARVSVKPIYFVNHILTSYLPPQLATYTC